MWVVTVHECGGSTAEAIDVYACFGGFLSGKEAEDFADVLYENLTFISKQQGGFPEWFTQHFEVPEIQKVQLPQITDQALLKKLDPDGKADGEGKIALDMRRLAQMVIDQKDFEPKPPPVKDEDVAAAIASITAGMEHATEATNCVHFKGDRNAVHELIACALCPTEGQAPSGGA